ncbi:MAG: TPR Domain containing protein [uncultured bacterium]|nr:MAG: TPR Domain containing protein [uncultured bacterium]KKT76864.1 MAG: TPR Domain containing protein [Candidatus Peregrinibacteria bacterium GW2011_GWA2_44_7]
MFYWIVFGISTFALIWIFWRRAILTRRGLIFEAQLRKEDERSLKQESEDYFPEESSTQDLMSKRQGEQRAREEKTRRLQEIKKAYQQGEGCFEKGDYEAAEKHFLQVLAFDNDHLDANLKLGLLYLHQENLPRAEFFFQKLMDLKESPVYCSNLALVLYQQNRLQESAQLYERAIEMDDKRAGRFVNLAHVYDELGEREKSLKAYEQASGLEPRNLDYLMVLVDYYEQFSLTDNLQRTLKRMLELDPYNEEILKKWSVLSEKMAIPPAEKTEE